VHTSPLKVSFTDINILNNYTWSTNWRISPHALITQDLHTILTKLSYLLTITANKLSQSFQSLRLMNQSNATSMTTLERRLRKISRSVVWQPVHISGSFCRTGKPTGTGLLFSISLRFSRSHEDLTDLTGAKRPVIKWAWLTGHYSVATCFHVVSWLAYSSTLNLKLVCYSETSVYFQQSTRCYFPESITDYLDPHLFIVSLFYQAMYNVGDYTIKFTNT
jgi:hypothetical protein